MKWITILFITSTALVVLSCSDKPVDPSRNPMSFIIAPDGSGDFVTIQDAIDAAIDGDTIELMNGVYQGDGNRDINFRGKQILVRSKSEDPDSCILDVQGSPEDQHRGFYFRSGEGKKSVLQGMTIINSYANVGGGGIRCEEASPHLVNLVLRNLQNMGISCSRASPLIERCIFESNSGEALSIWSSNPVVRDCQFIQNFDGAVGVFWSSATFENCSFIENESQFAGAIHIGAEPDAGGFVSFKDCIFAGNRAEKFGGAVLFADTPGELVDCVIIDNTAGEAGGAIRATLRTHVSITNTTMVGNGAPKGSNVFIEDGAKIAIEQSILAFGESGAAIQCDTTDAGTFGPVEVSISCCDIYGNSGGDWADCIEDLSSKNDNITEDPLFCSLSGRDLNLEPASPCSQSACGRMGALPVGCSGSLGFANQPLMLTALPCHAARKASVAPGAPASHRDTVSQQQINN